MKFEAKMLLLNVAVLALLAWAAQLDIHDSPCVERIIKRIEADAETRRALSTALAGAEAKDWLTEVTEERKR